MFFGGMVWGVDSDGSITVLLSLTTSEFHNLKSLVKALLSGEAPPVPSRPIPSEPRAEPRGEPPVTSVPARPTPSEPRMEPEPPATPVPAHSEPPDVSMVQQAEPPVTSVSPPPTPSEPTLEPEAPVTPVSPRSEPPDVNLVQQAEPPVTAVSARPTPSEPRMEPEAPATPVPPRPEPPDVNLAQQADALAARGDYEGAWRLYYEALQATPEDVSLWYGLGVTLSYLNKRKEAEEAFQYVARHGQPDSEEVRVARQWLVQARALAESAALIRVAEPVGDVRKDEATVNRKEATRRASEPGRAPVQPPRSKPSDPRPVQQAEARVTRVPPRRESSKVNLAQEAEALLARGDYEGAWKLYYRAVQAAPEDISLWYGLGATASNLSQRKEPEATPQRVVPERKEPETTPQRVMPHGQPDPKEVGLTRRALMSAGALAELSALTRAAGTVSDVRRAEVAAKGKTTRRASEPGRAPVQTPRAKPSEPRLVSQAEARIAQREAERASDRRAPRRRIDDEGSDDRTMERSIPKDEREQALLALIKEGYKMPPSRTELIAKVMELRNPADKERSRTSKKARGRARS